MIELTTQKIAEVTGSALINDVDPQAVVTGPAEFDSRKITPGAIFMALPGARADGHDFADAALQNGAALLIVGRPVEQPALLAAPVEVNEQTSNATAFEFDVEGHGAAVLAAVDKLARYNTDVLAAEEGMVVVGVTGSAGKTSTKDLIGAVLREAGETVAPPGSFNNEIGLPYTALRASRDTRFLVSEMSARGVGHIQHLTTVTPPRVGVVLNVGSAHLGEFGSRQAIAQAKGELVEALPAAAEGGLAVLNADDDKVAAMDKRTAARVVRFSTEGATGAAGVPADYYATDIELDAVARASFMLHHPAGQPVRVELSVFGAHQVSNALAAAAVGIELGIDAATVASLLSSHVAASVNRMDVRTRESDGVTIINDSYNANPESMRAGIDALAYTAKGRREAESWAVLGQMGELGEDASDEHAELGHVLAQRRIDHAVIVGNGVNQRALANAARESGVETHVVENIDGAVNYLDMSLNPQDVVLIKASYSDGLWAVAEGLLIGEDQGA
ncbi:UDP-N-acetylmuramoyl-tripeptide--D-alanyl-D-alanine ligase [Corynebacterium sp. ACRQJ]|uniref:UDP-N-acetylmuramoyl-tripeptide--D-alanyl-D- alanine ligase n=1 Tax=Corynebacterium sp. ACRQJ TaxID=2918189 RepID=UPI001EF63606|nr:UDP-N-acetylmuramoyl-tripeptide--D-alanyl-D-alanine ligase [Corynebacterium sp. ACRQJ]MCG7267114.1 UDP-N-acetylmuramoyl-tripeptide--D-alanyl-D-alanine ligase [Corynebacterium sp. ACRQJ]